MSHFSFKRIDSELEDLIRILKILIFQIYLEIQISRQNAIRGYVQAWLNDYCGAKFKFQSRFSSL